jgi:hypothetical protein
MLTGTEFSQIATGKAMLNMFGLFDIKVVVHDDFVEVRGAFLKPIEMDLEEMGSVATLRSM